jgi:putative membrane protein
MATKEATCTVTALEVAGNSVVPDYVGGASKMHPHSIGNWFCGPEGLFGFHFGGFFHLIIWGVALLLLFMLFRSLFASKQHNTHMIGVSSSALLILEERYASGEIDQEEFLRKKKDLEL